MALRDAIQIPDTETDSPGEFERLRRFILYHLGGFTLGLVRVNDPRQRDGGSPRSATPWPPTTRV